MKIGILTFHSAINYGAILQAKSLQDYFLDKGYECEIIDYKNSAFRTRYNFRFTTNIKQLIKNIILYPNLLIRKNKFKKFTSSNLNLSKEYDESNIKDINGYDILVSGSDQVLNMNLNGQDYVYYLDLNCLSIKVTYSASFGNYVPNETDLLKLKNLNSISLREKCENFEISGCQINLDPVFLHNKGYWDNMGFESKLYIKKKYLLLYVLHDSENIKEFAKNMAIKHNLKIIDISMGIKNLKMSKHLKRISPKDFLYLFSNAEFIISNSFHGVSFSIVMNKPFFTTIPSKKHGNNKRVQNLINLFSINSDVLIESDSCLPIANIDYENINSIIKFEKTKSDKFFCNILKKIKI